MKAVQLGERQYAKGILRAIRSAAHSCADNLANHVEAQWLAGEFGPPGSFVAEIGEPQDGLVLQVHVTLKLAPPNPVETKQ
jgi:hypothetical protein